jgi:hypothetical protein
MKERVRGERERERKKREESGIILIILHAQVSPPLRP